MKNKIEKNVVWKTKNGKSASVTVALETSRDIDADGYKVRRPCCELVVSGSVDNEHMGYEVDNYNDKPGYAGKIGRLLIPVEQMDAIDKIIAEIHATPEWQNKIATHEAAKTARLEYEAHCDKMTRIMGE